MRRPTRNLSVPAAILVLTCLTAGCGSTASSVISNLPSRTATAPAAPSTAPPATSGGPASSTATSTARPTVTVTTSPRFTSAAPATSVPAASATPGAGSGTSLLWLWILLAVAALGGLIAWIAHSARRRSAGAASWRSRLIDAYAKGSALHDAMSVAESPDGVAAGDAGARWSDVQRRADNLTQTLYALREAAPDDADQARIADVLVSLQAVRSAMDAERAPGGASPQQAQVVSDRLYAFELSLRALRGSGQEFT